MSEIFVFFGILISSSDKMISTSTCKKVSLAISSEKILAYDNFEALIFTDLENGD